MEAQMAHDIQMLEEKIKRLERSVVDFAKLLPGFGVIIHKPGWTSIAEFALVQAGIDNPHMQIETATEYCKRLLKAAEKVGGNLPQK